jgi:hypothetical protein
MEHLSARDFKYGLELKGLQEVERDLSLSNSRFLPMTDETPIYVTSEGRLSEKEITAANATWRVSEFFRQMEGACYRSAMFLRLYLKEKFGIEGQTIVGFVNDGEGPAYASHAWFEYEGKLTDIALAHPVDAAQTPPGRLIIQGVVVEPGHDYTYHETIPAIGEDFIKKFREHPLLAQMLRLQEETHAEASACANDDGLSRAYLDRAPDGWTYERIRAAIEEDVKHDLDGL